MISKCLRILGPVAILVFLLLANAAPTYGQSSGSMAIPADEQPDCDSPRFGFLEIDANRSGFADLSLTFCFDPSRAPESNQKLMAALGCPPDRTEVSSFRDRGLAGLEATCRIPIQQRALQFSGQVDVRPVQNFLKSAGVSALSVQILLPRYGVERCDPAIGEKAYTFKEAVGCKYVLKGAADDPPIILYSFGYDPALITRITSILGFLLLVPVVLTLWFRRRASNAPEESKAAVVFAYRRFVTGAVLGGALIWWTAVDLLHADDFVQLLVPLTRLNDDVLASVLPWISALDSACNRLFCLPRAFVSDPLVARLDAHSRPSSQPVLLGRRAVGGTVFALLAGTCRTVQLTSNGRTVLRRLDFHKENSQPKGRGCLWHGTSGPHLR